MHAAPTPTSRSSGNRMFARCASRVHERDVRGAGVHRAVAAAAEQVLADLLEAAARRAGGPSRGSGARTGPDAARWRAHVIARRLQQRVDGERVQPAGRALDVDALHQLGRDRASVARCGTRFGSMRMPLGDAVSTAPHCDAIQ